MCKSENCVACFCYTSFQGFLRKGTNNKQPEAPGTVEFSLEGFERKATGCSRCGAVGGCECPSINQKKVQVLSSRWPEAITGPTLITSTIRVDDTRESPVTPNTGTPRKIQSALGRQTRRCALQVMASNARLSRRASTQVTGMHLNDPSVDGDAEDGSASKALATQSQGHEFNPQNPPENAKH